MKTNEEMQAAINTAVSKGFIADPNWTVEGNYEAAVGFNNLAPEQQRELAAMAHELKKQRDAEREAAQ